jgi:hypothetical protein
MISRGEWAVSCAYVCCVVFICACMNAHCGGDACSAYSRSRCPYTEGAKTLLTACLARFGCDLRPIEVCRGPFRQGSNIPGSGRALHNGGKVEAIRSIVGESDSLAGHNAAAASAAGTRAGAMPELYHRWRARVKVPLTLPPVYLPTKLSSGPKEHAGIRTGCPSRLRKL